MKIPSAIRYLSVSTAVAIGLSACGGSSNTRTTEMPPPSPPPPQPTYSGGNIDLPTAVSERLTLPHNEVEERPIASGRSLEWGGARFNCVTPDSAVGDCRVRLTGTSDGVRAEAAGKVAVFTGVDLPPKEVSLEPLPHGQTAEPIDIDPGRERQVDDALFGCERPDAALEKCQVILTGTLDGVRVEAAGTVNVTSAATLSDRELPREVADSLELAQDDTEYLRIGEGKSMTWGDARFTCTSRDSAVGDCRVKLVGTSEGVRAKTAGTVIIATLSNPIAVDPNDLLARPIAVSVIRDAAGMTEEALREYIRQDAVRLNLNTEAERTARANEIRFELRKGEPIYQAISESTPVNLMEEGDGSVTQSSTTHARDMTASVDAWMAPAESSLSNPGGAGFSGRDPYDGPIYVRDGHPMMDGYPMDGSAIDESTPSRSGNRSRKWRNWSDRIAHTAVLSVDARWLTPENEDAQWSDGIDDRIAATVNLTTPASMDFGARLRRPHRPTEIPLPGGRVLNVDIHTDIGRTMPAQEVVLQGFIQDDDDAGGIPEGTMHADWRRGLDVIRFEEPELNTGAISPADLESGESEVFNRQRSFVDGWYRGIPGRFTCVDLEATCHIRNQTGRVNVQGDFRFTPDLDLRFTPPRLERVWNPDWLAIGVWYIAPDSRLPESPIHGDYEAGAFADGNDPFTAANLAAATRTATYSGSAYGMYTQALSREATVHRGRFSADATLEASFDPSQDDDAPLGTISGKLSDFRTDDGRDRYWVLNLEQIGIGNVGSVVGSTTVQTPIGTDVNRFTADTSGHADGHAIEGRWGGRFYGNIENQRRSTGYTGNQPGYVAGTFGASMKDGPADNGYDVNLIGAFAAERD